MQCANSAQAFLNNRGDHKLLAKTPEVQRNNPSCRNSRSIPPTSQHYKAPPALLRCPSNTPQAKIFPHRPTPKQRAAARAKQNSAQAELGLTVRSEQWSLSPGLATLPAVQTCKLHPHQLSNAFTCRFYQPLLVLPHRIPPSSPSLKDIPNCWTINCKGYKLERLLSNELLAI